MDLSLKKSSEPAPHRFALIPNFADTCHLRSYLVPLVGDSGVDLDTLFSSDCSKMAEPFVFSLFGLEEVVVPRNAARFETTIVVNIPPISLEQAV